MDNLLLRVTALNRRFGNHAAVSDVTLCLEQGEVLGLLGPNGAGKTTCLRILSGMLAPSSGQVMIAGIDLARRPLEAKRSLGYLPERPPLYPELRVDEYLHFCARLRQLPRKRVLDAVDDVKARCGLEDSGRRLIAKLSKGFRQRLGIAQAIIHRPRLLILDEPTEGLDPFQMRDLRRLIRDLSKDCGIILASHLLPEVQAVCDRAAILDQGRICFNDCLAAEQDANGWRIRLGAGSALGQLLDLACVEECAGLDQDVYRVTLADGTTSADLARQIQEAGMQLFELTPEHSDLERVFFDLIGVEDQT